MGIFRRQMRKRVARPLITTVALAAILAPTAAATTTNNIRAIARQLQVRHLRPTPLFPAQFDIAFTRSHARLTVHGRLFNVEFTRTDGPLPPLELLTRRSSSSAATSTGRSRG
jgi:hypothetical protein